MEFENGNETEALISGTIMSVKEKKTSKGNFFAIVKGSIDTKYLVSSFIKGESKPKIGDILVTSGNTKTFPQNILVGKIIKIDDSSFIVIPYVDFSNLSYVQIIDNK